MYNSGYTLHEGEVNMSDEKGNNDAAEPVSSLKLEDFLVLNGDIDGDTEDERLVLAGYPLLFTQ
jgi:hypothetical protein